jgi:exosome complex RNA-binding protein Rrp42 (RNase PH superfamily)
MFNIISNSEKEFLLKYLKEDKRLDDRGLEDYRKIKITKLDENGQIETKLGNTLVISQIFAKLVAPNKERPSEGVIVFSV